MARLTWLIDVLNCVPAELDRLTVINITYGCRTEQVQVSDVPTGVLAGAHVNGTGTLALSHIS